MYIELVPNLNDFSYDGIGTVMDSRAGLPSKNYELLYLGAAAAYVQQAFRMGTISLVEEEELMLCIQVLVDGM